MERLNIFTFEALKKRLPIIEMSNVPAPFGLEDARYFAQEALTVDHQWRHEFPLGDSVPHELVRLDGADDGFPERFEITVRPLNVSEVLVPDATSLMLVSKTQDGWLLTVYSGVKDVVAELTQLAEDFADTAVKQGSVQYSGASIGE